MSKSLMRPKLSPEARILPSGLKAGLPTFSVPAAFPLATSHSVTSWSSLPETKVLPSLLKATAETAPVWPFKVRFTSPVAASRSMMVLSALPEANQRPSALYASPNTAAV